MSLFTLTGFQARRIITIAVAVLCTITPACSQLHDTFGSKVDSLKSLLSVCKGAARQEVLFQLGYEYLRVDDSVALPFATEAHNMSWQFGDSAMIVKSGRVKAMILYELSKYDSVIGLSSFLLPIARRNGHRVELGHLLNILALAHTLRAEYDKALTYNFESLEIRKKYEDDFSVGIALNNIGLVYYKIDDLMQALNYFEKSLELKMANKELLKVDKVSYATTMVNISLCYYYMKDLNKAEQYLKSASAFCAEECSSSLLMQIYFVSGLINYTKGNVQDARSMFLRSLSLAQKLPDHRVQLENLTYLSKMSLESNKLIQAERYLLQAEPFFDDGIPFRAELADLYLQLAQIYTRAGEYRKANEYQSKHIDLTGKIYTRQLTVNLMKIQAEYLERENNAKIKARDQILALNNDLIARQHALNIIVGIVAVLSLALTLALLKIVREKRKANNILEQKVKERTIELENKHDLLVRSMHERDVEVQRMTNEIRASLSTIKGLGLLVLHDVNTHSATHYVSKIEQTSNDLLEGLTPTRGSISD